MDSNNTSAVASPVVPRAVDPDNETPSFDGRTVEQRDAQAEEIMTLSRQVLEDPTQPADYKAGVAQNLEVLEGVRSLIEGASEDSGDESDGSELCFHIFCDDGCRGECLKDKPGEDSTLSAKQMEINQEWKRFSINNLNENFRYLRVLIEKGVSLSQSERKEAASLYKDLGDLFPSDTLDGVKALESKITALRPENVEQEELDQAKEELMRVIGRLEGKLLAYINLLRDGHPSEEELAKLDALVKLIKKNDDGSDSSDDSDNDSDGYGFGLFDSPEPVRRNVPAEDVSGSSSGSVSSDDSDGELSDDSRRALDMFDALSGVSNGNRVLSDWGVLHVRNEEGPDEQVPGFALLSPSEQIAFSGVAPVTRDVVRPQVSEEKSLLGAFGQMLCHPPANLLLLIFLYFLVFQHVSESGEL
tara:strand:- start:93247 stop:94494 length:1248 start_codon:yes stop_codon:yes gene_type:complete